MSASVEGSKQNILDHIQTLSPVGRLYYLEVLASATRAKVIRFYDTENRVEATEEINAWVRDLVAKTPIPEGYFNHCIDCLMEKTHPLMRPQFHAALLKMLSQLTEEKARQHATMVHLTDEQFPVIYHQLQVWVAEHQRPAAANLN